MQTKPRTELMYLFHMSTCWVSRNLSRFADSGLCNLIWFCILFENENFMCAKRQVWTATSRLHSPQAIVKVWGRLVIESRHAHQTAFRMMCNMMCYYPHYTRVNFGPAAVWKQHNTLWTQMIATVTKPCPFEVWIPDTWRPPQEGTSARAASPGSENAVDSSDVSNTAIRLPTPNFQTFMGRVESHKRTKLK